MPYRWPIKTGDRVALAPHLDLWMTGLRHGRVEQVAVALTGETCYYVRCNHRTAFWTTEPSDLLGAVV